MEDGSVYLTKREVDALENELESFWCAEKIENIAMQGRQLAAVVDYILMTRRNINATDSQF